MNYFNRRKFDLMRMIHTISPVNLDTTSLRTINQSPIGATNCCDSNTSSSEIYVTTALLDEICNTSSSDGSSSATHMQDHSPYNNSNTTKNISDSITSQEVITTSQLDDICNESTSSAEETHSVGIKGPEAYDDPNNGAVYEMMANFKNN
jgi:hypothetical protein